MCGFISGLSILFCWSIFLLLGAHLLWGLDLGPQSSDSSGYSREAWPGEAWPGGVAWGGMAWGVVLGGVAWGVAWGGHYVRTEKRKEGRKLDRVMTICLEETH